MEPVATENQLGYPPLPANEYDAYLSELLRLIGQGASPEDLLNYLATVETDYLMLTNPVGDKQAFIRSVLAASGEAPPF
jgi:hypothetical protein